MLADLDKLGREEGGELDDGSMSAGEEVDIRRTLSGSDTEVGIGG
jgi:hypothetical protein